jgi:hypothetical protein
MPFMTRAVEDLTAKRIIIVLPYLRAAAKPCSAHLPQPGSVSVVRSASASIIVDFIEPNMQSTCFAIHFASQTTLQ